MGAVGSKPKVYGESRVAQFCVRDEGALVRVCPCDALRRYSGCPGTSSLAERHRKLLSRRFPVTPSKHVLIARFYTDDPRFPTHFDRYGDGLSVWMREIIEANSVCHGVNADMAQWE